MNPNFNQETLQLVAQGARLLQLLGDDWKEKIIAYADRIRKMEHPEYAPVQKNIGNP